MITDHFEIYGPADGIVEAWAMDYVPFEAQHRSEWQQRLSREIKTRSGELRPEDGQVLHATFFGGKKDNADVENVVLYCFGSFGKAGGNGIRFEHGASVPSARSGTGHPFCYRYALAPENDGYSHWQQGRKLASFEWTDLGEFKTDKLLAQVWLAIARRYERGQVKTFSPEITPGTPFAVNVQIRPPAKHQRVLGNMVKGIVDGVVSAFQSHTDLTVLPEVIPPLEKNLKTAAVTTDATEIEHHLRQQRRGVLGKVFRLVRASNTGGVVWAPDDQMCVAGQLLRVSTQGDRHWAIKGEVVQLSPLDDR